jgi:Flp pilus assembly protein TadB
MKEEKENTWRSHSFWMVLCCAIPLVGIIVLSLVGILGSWGFYALILLCPLLHLFFMRRMVSKDMHKRSGNDRMMGPGR